MDEMLTKIKDRLHEKSSPIKSLKGLSEAIGMSEGGFYAMFRNRSMKLKTQEAICAALNVGPDFFDSGNGNKVEPDAHFGEITLERIMHDMHEMRQVFEEQLRAKDRQIERLLDLLGKPEGAIVDGPLSTAAFDAMMNTYRSSFFGRFGVAPLFSAVSVAKLVAPRSL